jgi:hypothetical protein
MLGGLFCTAFLASAGEGTALVSHLLKSKRRKKKLEGAAPKDKITSSYSDIRVKKNRGDEFRSNAAESTLPRNLILARARH